MKKWAWVACAATFMACVFCLPRFVVGQEKKTVKIGVLADKTGGLAAYGYSHEKVLKAAATMINGKGGIAGRPVKLYVDDTESKPSVGALKFRKLVETDGVDFVIDSNMSGVAVACAPIAKELKTPYFPSASATEISGEKGNRYVFQLCTSIHEEAKGYCKVGGPEPRQEMGHRGSELRVGVVEPGGLHKVPYGERRAGTLNQSVYRSVRVIGCPISRVRSLRKRTQSTSLLSARTSSRLSVTFTRCARTSKN